MIYLVGILSGLLILAVNAAWSWHTIAMEYRRMVSDVVAKAPKTGPVEHKMLLRSFNGLPAIVGCACGYRPSPDIDPEDAIAVHIAMHRAGDRARRTA
jgi:hypothetical protein